MLLTGKTAIVTGGSRGIGRAVSLLLAREGANVAIVYAGNTAAAEETKQQAEALGAAAAVFQCDVADEQAVADMVKAVKTQFGSVDILVNNAGITRDGLLMRMKEADWQAVLDTNLTGVYHCTKAVSKLMMKQRHGAVINCPLSSGKRAMPDRLITPLPKQVSSALPKPSPRNWHRAISASMP